MGQAFGIVAPYKQEALNLPHTELLRMLFDRSPASLVELFAHPVEPHAFPKFEPERIGRRLKFEVGNEASGEFNQSSLYALPNELLDIIFELLNMEDAVSLSLSNSLFERVGQKHIRALYIPHLGRWADERVIAIGKNIYAGDWPELLLDKDGRDEFDALVDEDTGIWATLYDVFTLALEDNPLSPHASQTLPDKFLGDVLKDRRWNSITHWEASRLLDIICPWNDWPGDCYDKKEPWVLRNLNKKELVRVAAIALRPEYIHGPFVDFLGLGEAILSRICWSSEPVQRQNCQRSDLNLHRGVWAGDALDIVLQVRHEQGVKRKKEGHLWKDVSDEVSSELRRLWKIEFGGNWQEIICKTSKEMQNSRINHQVGLIRREKGHSMAPEEFSRTLKRHLDMVPPDWQVVGA
ncbi:uncharacterized protein BDR25DRAFT_339362 [Lindgomyces ingoldianus]|uniref:Uncharacterized protein n=1 Tax=Lindgomyces ingoldianus TaxID=673940 RepID=A0ACB6RB61_9PLEO|nr:uncharacterized protein BDR25DRAFT_339362 [Lindgomyces ingoldianus]KAF2476295.1 hypothetical protein BDR25DRAFT_339362 [Lindgomyces ingoldianus]